MVCIVARMEMFSLCSSHNGDAKSEGVTDHKNLPIKAVQAVRAYNSSGLVWFSNFDAKFVDRRRRGRLRRIWFSSDSRTSTSFHLCLIQKQKQAHLKKNMFVGMFQGNAIVRAFYSVQKRFLVLFSLCENVHIFLRLERLMFFLIPSC